MLLADDLVHALDPTTFARRLGFVPDRWQADVLRSGARQLLLNCCRQSGKSTTASVLALHTATYQPGALTLLVSPSLRQSSELFRTVRRLAAALDPAPALVEDNKLSLTLGSGSRIVSLPNSEATVRGYAGVRLIVEDEASRVADDLHHAVRPMLAVSGGRLVLMSTPFGQRGHFFEAWEHGGADWQRVRITAGECPRIPAAFLAEERRALPDAWYRAEYEAEFTATVDSVFGYDDIAAAFSSDVKPLFAGSTWSTP